MKITAVIIYTFLLIAISTISVASQKLNIAFYYGYRPHVEKLRLFDIVVIQPDAQINVNQFYKTHTKLYAYVSVGEIDKDEPYAVNIKSSWIIGENKNWDSNIADVSNPKYRSFLTKQVFVPLWKKGYRGFFLDDLDSYQILNLSQKDQKKQLMGLVSLIKKIKKRLPNAKIILNRGFDIIPNVYAYIQAVVVESLFQGWNESTKQYYSVPIAVREALLSELQKIQKYNLPIIVIDYVDPSNKKLTEETANKIRKLGYIPWITNNHLTHMGLSGARIIADGFSFNIVTSILLYP